MLSKTSLLLRLVVLSVPLIGLVKPEEQTEQCSPETGGRRCESCEQMQPIWPDGEIGEMGEVGERGNPGLDGKDGTPGRKGETGESGDSGVQGPPGLTGDKGEPGERGPQGPRGLDAQATPADKGPKGVQGPKGRKGPSGFPGCPGKAGKQGIIGENGTIGEKGLEGPVGKPGQEGDTGARGPAGAPGSHGPPGRKGAKGLKGERGMIGPVGDTGEAGEDGTAGVPGTVDTEYSPLRGPKGPPGPPGNANCTLDPTDIGEELRGEKGDKGDVGERGEYGDPGEQGQQGPPCDCTGMNKTTLKAPHGVAGPSGLAGNSEDFKGSQGDAITCKCKAACLEMPKNLEHPGSLISDKPIPKSIRKFQGIPGPQGERGEKGDRGPSGPGAQGDTGPKGPRGKGACCKKPPEDRSFGRTPTLYVVHSQSTKDEEVDCKDDQAELLWKGYSFLYGDINRVATGQDLGRPGSCVTQLDPLPYTDCAPGMLCNSQQRSMQAIWLSAYQNGSTTKQQVPFEKLPQHVSRCAVCVARSPVITLHRRTSCPVNTRLLWRGFSLAMFSSSMLSVSADLSKSGSCIQHFQTGLAIECDTSKNCRRYHDFRSHWLHGLEEKPPGEVQNCVVCVDERTNDFERDLPRPRIYAEHYQSTVAPINPCSSAPGVFPIMANGYSLLHLEDTRAVVQDLGSAGSCLPRFSHVPFLTCSTFGNCYAKERQTKAAWLNGLNVPASAAGTGGKNLGINPIRVLSRCSICISDGPIVTIHSHNNTIPSCPQAAGRWTSLWSGYSFLGHFANSAGGQQPLDSPGSCLRDFMSPTYFECSGANAECSFQSDQHDFWLTASNVDAASLQRNTRQTLQSTDRQAPLTASIISRCTVCKLIINN